MLALNRTPCGRPTEVPFEHAPLRYSVSEMVSTETKLGLASAMVTEVTFGAAARAEPEPREAKAFGLECWTDGAPHHYNLTWDTMWNGKNADGTWISVSENASRAVAWQNDALDYYDNNPFMFAQTRDFMETG